jgi:hypothetical protein
MFVAHDAPFTNAEGIVRPDYRATHSLFESRHLDTICCPDQKTPGRHLLKWRPGVIIME